MKIADIIVDELQKVDLSLGAIVSVCTSIEFNDGVLWLDFPYSFHKEKAESRSHIILDVAKSITESDVELKCTLNGKKEIIIQYAEEVNIYEDIPQPKVDTNNFQETESPIEEIFLNALHVTDFIVPQFQIGVYRVDFAIESMRIAIELDGHDFHSSKEQRTEDAKRMRYLQKDGWTVVRFTGTEIYKDVRSCISDLKGIMKMCFIQK